MCVCEVSWKYDIFYGLLKKRKFVLLDVLVLTPNFILFTHATRQVEFSW
jgi:hypothetical protein